MNRHYRVRAEVEIMVSFDPSLDDVQVIRTVDYLLKERVVGRDHALARHDEHGIHILCSAEVIEAEQTGDFVEVDEDGQEVDEDRPTSPRPFYRDERD